MVRNNYSRRQSVEKKRNLRSAFIYGFLTIALLAAIFFLGLPALVKFAGFVGNIGRSDNPIEINDTTPPPPPLFESPEEYISADDITLHGTAESGSSVNIYYNNEHKEIISDADSTFEVNIDLLDGRNVIYATATDKAGNESGDSERIEIYHDSSPPEIEITEPISGQQYSGEENRITVKGTVSETADITVNERIAVVGSDNQFSIEIGLNEGNNEIKVKARDRAGNETEKSIAVTYRP